ncbi:hypothetical protein V1511DRAFT_400291 [Dipodascopsis uninucleata]
MDLESSKVHNFWKRSLVERACVTCTSSDLSCSKCSSDEDCQLTLQTCSSCPTIICVKSSSSSSSGSSSSGSLKGSSPSSSTPAVVGGVVGGLVFISLIAVGVYLVLRRRKIKSGKLAFGTISGSVDDEKNSGNHPNRTSSIISGRQHGYGNLPEANASSHTVSSFASSAIARASNIIPIAYIPGVINRSNTNSPGVIPPIPEVPASFTGPNGEIIPMENDNVQPILSTRASQMDMHSSRNSNFPTSQRFRNYSQYSNMSRNTQQSNISSMYDDRGYSMYSGYDSMEDQSVRASVATSAFAHSVIISPAMMTAIRAKPNLIVRKNGPNPPLPAASLEEYSSRQEDFDFQSGGRRQSSASIPASIASNMKRMDSSSRQSFVSALSSVRSNAMSKNENSSEVHDDSSKTLNDGSASK